MEYKFPSITPDVLVVMPDHFHGIIFIRETVGDDLRVGPVDMINHDGLETGDDIDKGEHVGSPLRNDGMGEDGQMGAHADAPLPNNGTGDNCKKGEHIGSPLRENGMNAPIRGIPHPNAPISQIVQWFKKMTNQQILRGVEQYHWPSFAGKLWQRNY